MNIVMNGKGDLEDGGVHEVKDMKGEKQVVADPTTYDKGTRLTLISRAPLSDSSCMGKAGAQL